MTHRYLYLRDYSLPNKHPVGCVAVEVDEAANEIRYAFSACSPFDKFNAQLARDKASGRLTQSPTVIVGKIPESYHAIMRHVMQHIVDANKTQKRDVSRSYVAYQSALTWLKSTEMHAS
jgi:hypothetical protein